jgi:release factor glutamine methyltransferase
MCHVAHPCLTPILPALPSGQDIASPRPNRPPVDAQTLAEAVAETAHLLAQAGVDTPRLEAEVLVREAAEVSKERLFSHPELPLSPEARGRLEGFVARRLRREPLPYVLGHAEFYSLTFRITPAVISPRPETEILVEGAVKRAREISARLLVDVGTGSGAIAVVLARELPEARVIAVDVSREALRLTRENCVRHGVAARVWTVCGDLLSALEGEADAIVGNLPYVESGVLSALQPEVRDFEPRAALDGGYDGLEVIRRLSVQLPSHLSKRGFVALEVGAGQAGGVAKLLAADGLGGTEIVRDYAGIERVVIARREG